MGIPEKLFLSAIHEAVVCFTYSAPERLAVFGTCEEGYHRWGDLGDPVEH